ncbi:MAG: hypothetical protein FJ214_01540 [Ignavibacteria bacterium]|nr:hypothetical protein [Ignavibacteria bacterium]
MEKNFYSEENNRHSELIKDLNKLPKISAPENFEFSLMTRIQNQNFIGTEELKPQFNLVKFFAPSAVVAVVIIMFFLFLPSNDSMFENPLMSEPTIIAEKSKQIIGSASNGAENIKSTKKKNASNKVQLSTSNNYDIVVNRNDAVMKEKAKYPIFSKRSVSLDDYISGDNAKRNNLQEGNVVRASEESPEFDGFFVKQEPDKKTIEKYRAMLDSAKKAQTKADSVKKAKKVE